MSPGKAAGAILPKFMRNNESEAVRRLSLGRAVSNNVTAGDSVADLIGGADLASDARSIIFQLGGRERLIPGATSMDETLCCAKTGTARNALVRTPETA